jgi:hypothetical protein
MELLVNHSDNWLQLGTIIHAQECELLQFHKHKLLESEQDYKAITIV